MAKFIDLTDQRFGKLVCLYRTDRRPGNYWMCQCDCGNVKEIISQSIKHQNTGCGCESGNKKHGFYSQNAFLCDHYHKMMSRCYKPWRRDYKNWGARGIKVCDEWNNPESGLANFILWASSHETYKEGLSLERKNVDGNYTPENCEWIPMAEQAWNKQNSFKVEINGNIIPLRKAYELYGNKEIKYETVRSRVKNGWDVMLALTKEKR